MAPTHLLALLLALAAPCLGGAQVAELTDGTLDSFIADGSHFVKFYAPWCGHCKRLAPTWEKLPQSLGSASAAKISKVDCTTQAAACKRFEVRSYPTLLWIENGKVVEKYSGDRSLENLTQYVKGKLPAEPVAKVVSNPVLEISHDSFESAVKHGVTFVKFFAPWCGHCKKLASTWDQLGEKFLTKQDVTIAKVDCTKAQNHELCKQQEVNGFPTLYVYRNGQKLTEYEGDRQLDDLAAFVNKYLQYHDEVPRTEEAAATGADTCPYPPGDRRRREACGK